MVWSAIRKRKASQSSNSANDAGEGAAAAAAAAKGSGGSKETPSKKKRAKVGEEEGGSGPGRTAYLMYRVDQQQDTPTLPATTIAKMWKTLDPVRTQRRPESSPSSLSSRFLLLLRVSFIYVYVNVCVCV